MDNTVFDALHDRQVTLALQHLGADLLPPAAVVNGLADRDGALSLLRAFTASVAASGGVTDQTVQADAKETLGRETLLLALHLPESTDLAADLVADPPDDDQMGMEDFPQYAAALGFLVAYLQTRFHVSVSRKDGRTEWHVDVGKEALADEQMDKVLGIAGALINHGPTEH